eukprot:3239002-Rhodomonas_salina.1
MQGANSLLLRSCLASVQNLESLYPNGCFQSSARSHGGAFCPFADTCYHADSRRAMRIGSQIQANRNVVSR